MLKSLRNRLLVYLILVAIFIACLVFPLNYFHRKAVNVIHEKVALYESLYLEFIRDLKTTGEFLTYETSNSDFFITGQSPLLNVHESSGVSIRSKIDFLSNENSSLNLSENNIAEDLRQVYNRYCLLLDSLVYYVYKRGYRDFGIEGEMISYIFQAEMHPVVRNNSVELRRNERDYLNRNDQVCIEALNASADELIGIIRASKSVTQSDRLELISLLSSYRESFNKLIELDSRLGLHSRNGLKSSLLQTGDEMEKLIVKAIDSAKQAEASQVTRINIMFVIISMLLFIATILASIFLSRHLMNHLELLTGYISQLSKNNFNYDHKELNLRRSSSEIREIYGEFRNMVAQLKIREKQRDNALAEVMEKGRMYREMADLLPQSIFEANRLGNIEYTNKAWHKAFGYSSEDIVEGLNLIECLQTNVDNNLFGINKVENSDFIAIRKDGTRFPALVYSDVIVKEGKITGRRGIIIDATLRNKYIETLQKETVKAVTSDKLKSSFLANMSHEIRTPMNSIIGFSNLLTAEQIPEEQKKEFISHIQSSGQVLLSLIDDIIDIAKIEAGEIKIKPVRCEPAKLMNDLLKTFQGYRLSIGKQHIDLLAQIPNTEIPFRTDAFRLRQILTNLVSNALKFTEKGSVIISCEIKKEKFIEFSVEDTGIGLTKEDLNVLFNRFQRTKYSEEKNISGTGLGLTISKNLVELLGGQMWVSSVPGEGTRFWFQLPYTPIPETGDTTRGLTSEVAGKKYFNWTSRTILIAEDDDNSFTLLKEILHKTRARIVHAVNGKEVIEAVKFSDEIDIILMDIQMPFINGYVAAKEIKKIRPGLPIIAQTAYAMEGDREKAILSGCDDYIVKPVNPANLLAKIEQFIAVSDKQSVINTGNHREGILKSETDPERTDDKQL